MSYFLSQYLCCPEVDYLTGQGRLIGVLDLFNKPIVGSTSSYPKGHIT